MKITDKSVKNLLEAGLVFLGNLQVSNNQLLDIKSWATELLEQGIEPTDALVELATLNSSTASSVDVQHFMRELLSTAGYEIPDTEGILKIYLKQVMENIASKKLEIEKGLNEVSEIALRLKYPADLVELIAVKHELDDCELLGFDREELTNEASKLVRKWLERSLMPS